MIDKQSVVTTLETFNSTVSEMLSSSFYGKNTVSVATDGKETYRIGASNEEFVFMITKLRFVDNDKDGISLRLLKSIYGNRQYVDTTDETSFLQILDEIEKLRKLNFRLDSDTASDSGMTIREAIHKYTYGKAAHLNQKGDFNSLVKKCGSLFYIELFVGIQNLGVYLSRIRKLNEDVLKKIHSSSTFFRMGET